MQLQYDCVGECHFPIQEGTLEVHGSIPPSTCEGPLEPSQEPSFQQSVRDLKTKIAMHTPANHIACRNYQVVFQVE